MNILVTGSNGFIGTEFLSNLNKTFLKKNKVYALSRKRPNQKLKNIKYISFIITDLKKNLKKIERKKIDVAIHFAAQANHHIKKSQKKLTKDDNVKATKNLLSALNKNCLFFFTSSDKVYNPRSKCCESSILKPQTYLAKQKIIFEKMIKKKFKKYFIFRLPIVHSNGKFRDLSIIDQFLYDLKKNKSINVFSNIKRSFIQTKELNQAILNCLKLKNYGTYNLGTKLYFYN